MDLPRDQRRLALGISYRGGAYDGWQSQANGRGVQDQLEAALAAFTTHPVSTVCAGRTDAGVHGVAQVVHIDTTLDRTPQAWVRGTNTNLPRDIAVQWCVPVDDNFHARRSALGRAYSYLVLNAPVRPALEVGQVGWWFRVLDEQAMQAAADVLIGTHDFSSFRSSRCQSPTPIKTLRSIQVRRLGAYLRIDFEGNAFLHHMIRNIMGCLLAVGSGSQDLRWMKVVLDARDRVVAAPTFSADGLYFLGPSYDKRWGLPCSVPSHQWLPQPMNLP